ncbi:MAG TPA: hypothetical protein VIZ90_20405 [Rhizobiaceae bacterium]
MDWDAAIEKNRAALKRVLAMLVAMAGLSALASPLAGEDGSVRRGKAEPLAEPGEGCFSPAPTLPRRLHRAVLALLRPAEAAARRLIIVAARGLVVPPPGPRKPKAGPAAGNVGNPRLPPLRKMPRRAPALPLFDPLPPWNRRVRRAALGVPRISVPGFGRPFPIPLRPSPEDPVDAARIALRLAALAAALDDLPDHARRFARRRARPAANAAGGQDGEAARPVRFRRRWPLRPGRPPGWRRRPTHEVHEVLNDVHGLAYWALESPDTS